MRAWLKLMVIETLILLITLLVAIIGTLTDVRGSTLATGVVITLLLSSTALSLWLKIRSRHKAIADEQRLTRMLEASSPSSQFLDSLQTAIGLALRDGYPEGEWESHGFLGSVGYVVEVADVNNALLGYYVFGDHMLPQLMTRTPSALQEGAYEAMFSPLSALQSSGESKWWLDLVVLLESLIRDRWGRACEIRVEVDARKALEAVLTYKVDESGEVSADRPLIISNDMLSEAAATPTISYGSTLATMVDGWLGSADVDSAFPKG